MLDRAILLISKKETEELLSLSAFFLFQQGDLEFLFVLKQERSCWFRLQNCRRIDVSTISTHSVFDKKMCLFEGSLTKAHHQLVYPHTNCPVRSAQDWKSGKQGDRLKQWD